MIIRACCLSLLVSIFICNTRAQEIPGRDMQLLIAAYDGDSAAVTSLINEGANVNITSFEGTTPLMLAAQNGHMPIVSLLVTKKAAIDTRTPEGLTALILSIEAGQIAVAEFLIRNGANVQLADAAGRSPLMHAVVIDSFYLPDMLIYYGADINHKDNEDVDALMLACNYNRFEIAVLLLESGAEINRADHMGNTPLHYAVNSKNPSIMDLLILNGSEIDEKNDAGYTPLSLAVSQNLYEEALLLISYGADVNTKIRSSLNPLAIALKNGNNDMIRLLRVHGAALIKLPDFSVYTISAGAAANKSDSRLNLGFGLSDPVFYWMPSVSYGLRPSRAFIMEKKDTSEYYQFSEFRHYLRLDLNKGFFVRRFQSGFTTAAYAGAGGVLTFGSYKGSEEKPDTRFVFAPHLGVLFNYKLIRVKAGYEFLNLKQFPVSKNWFTFSIELMLNNSKKNLNPQI